MIRIEMSDNGGVICSIIDTDEPGPEQKFTYATVDEALAKVREVMKKESGEKDIPQTTADVKKHLHTKNIGSTASSMKAGGY